MCKSHDKRIINNKRKRSKYSYENIGNGGPVTRRKSERIQNKKIKSIESNFFEGTYKLDSNSINSISYLKSKKITTFFNKRKNFYNSDTKKVLTFFKFI